MKTCIEEIPFLRTLLQDRFQVDRAELEDAVDHLCLAEGLSVLGLPGVALVSLISRLELTRQFSAYDRLPAGVRDGLAVHSVALPVATANSRSWTDVLADAEAVALETRTTLLFHSLALAEVLEVVARFNGSGLLAFWTTSPPGADKA